MQPTIFYLIVKEYDINIIPKCTPFWHEMFKIASVSWVHLRPLWGSLRYSARPPCREGLLAFGNCSFAPSELAISPTHVFVYNKFKKFPLPTSPFGVYSALICSPPMCPTNLNPLKYALVDYVVIRPKGRGFESRASRHLGTLGKSFTHSCLLCFGAKLQHSIHDVSRAPLSGLEEAQQKQYKSINQSINQ